MFIGHTRVCAGAAARAAITLAVSILVSGCLQTGSLPSDPANERADVLPSYYRALATERFPVPAVRASDLDPKYARQRVRYSAPHPVGTIVVDPDAKFLYLLMEDGYALRYGIGVGREGFGWSGTAKVARKANWPTWTPPAEMIRRQPTLARYRGGMQPGIDNPLGARALYLYQDGRDTLYRIHGTNEPWSIGQNVSSGCIRLLNQDVIDLFERAPVGAQVVVLRHGELSKVAAPSHMTPARGPAGGWQ
jgi:lipoprotein-anchoring transpeptidase ErfK/SrfK